MKYYIKIQSVNDIITNSSSEVFTIHTDFPWHIVRECLHDYLRGWGYTDEDIYDDPTIGGNIIQEDPETVVIAYSICNVNEDIYGALIELFGKDNVRRSYY